MFKKETTGLCYLVTFFTPNAMFLYNKINVGNDVFINDGAWQQITMMRKKKPHLLHVIADGSGRVVFGSQHGVQLLQGILCR